MVRVGGSNSRETGPRRSAAEFGSGLGGGVKQRL